MKIARREILKWCGPVAGLPILYPFVSAMVKEAHGQGATTPRYIQFVSGNGIWKKDFKPYYVPNGESEASLMDRPLPAIFKNFEAHKEKMMILCDFYCPYSLHIHGNSSSVWDGFEVPDVWETNYKPGGKTMDRIAGEHLSASDPIQSLNFVCATYNGHFNNSNVSGDGYDQKFAADYKPIEAFDRMFRQPVDPDGDEAAALLEQQKSVLDFAARDISRLEKRLAGHERAKLQQFTESIRGLEQQLERLSTLTCTTPTEPDPLWDSADPPQTSEWDVEDDGFVHETFKAVVQREIADSFIEMAAVAVACNMTHSVNITFDTTGAVTTYPFLGDDVRAMHLHAHIALAGSEALADVPLNSDSRIRAVDMMANLWDYYGEQINGMYARLGEMSEGDGTLADNTLMCWTSNCGGRHHNGNHEYPLILLGDAGGAFDSGRLVNFGDGEAGRNDDDAVNGTPPPRALNDAWFTILQGLGIEQSGFGEPHLFTGPLDGVLR